jgi:hypothetical protein
MEYIRAIKVPKTDILRKYSNPNIAQEEANRYFNEYTPLYKSSKKDKKYMLKNPNGKWVHFGQLGYEDFTKHQNIKKWVSYRLRAENMRGNWKKDPYSPNNLSINILW